MRYLIRVAAVVIGGMNAAHAADETPSSAHARSLAATCASCHTTGNDSTLPSLSGMPESSIVQAMHAFKTGTREGTVMPQLAKGYSDAQIAAIAAWYAKAKR